MEQTEQKQDAQQEQSGSELIFISVEEGIAREFERNTGTVLLVSDESAYSVFTTAASRPNAISIVIEEDVLPLFSMPEATCVLGAGGKRALFAARFYAETHHIPCALFPMEATLTGVLERTGEILMNGESTTANLSAGRVYCDMQILGGTLGRAYARLLLAQLEVFEKRALQEFGIASDRIAAFAAVELTPEKIIVENALRGELKGEGNALVKLLEGRVNPEWRAFLLISSLYAAFFEKGKPRRYYTPDYKARAKAANTKPPASSPTTEEYALRAMKLEKIRAGYAREIINFTKQKEAFAQTVAALSAHQDEGDIEADLPVLKYLPEHFEGGLSSVIRDFGLMDWE